MKQIGRILIVDDNEDVLLSLNMLLRPVVEAVRVLTNPERIPEFMQTFKPDVILLDMNFQCDMESGEEGYEWLARILKIDPTSVVVFMTAYVNTEKTVRAIKAGAIDFIPKPWENKKLIDTISSAISLKHSRTAAQQTFTEAPKTTNQQHFIGESQPILTLKERIARIAPTEANVLITGENGTGKDVVAHEIHRLSNRADRPLVTIDLGTIPESLFESELFGHEKGAFTGATSTKEGRIEQANGGTLFLDEIGNLSLAMQHKLLTVIEKHETTKVGATNTQKIEVRIIAATNANLLEKVAQGTFREDLYYRLNTIQLHLPPLRERANDILLLANYFAKRFSVTYNSPQRTFTPQEQAQMLNYTWPGNVRELQHVIERWTIDPDTTLLPSNTSIQQPENNIAAPLNLEELERSAISRAISQANGNLTAAAELLGITRYALYRKLEKHGI